MPINLPDPVWEVHDGIIVVRDDVIPGGTKRRAISALFTPGIDEYVYASPVFGYAQVALAHAVADHSFGPARATIFCAQRAETAPLTRRANEAGAMIMQVSPGYLNVVRARAREYVAADASRKLMPFGFDDPAFIAALADVARRVPIVPHEVWCVAGSGVLTRALQLAWPTARHYAVRVGADPNVGRATRLDAPERYEQNARIAPPFPSCANYDAKAWQFVRRHASLGALFWNVAA